MSEHGEVETRLRKAFEAELPKAPTSLVERLDAGPVGRSAPSRPRPSLLLLPAALAIALVAVGVGIGGKPEPSASIGPSSHTSSGQPAGTRGTAFPSATPPAETAPNPRPTAISVAAWPINAIDVVSGPANVTDLWALDTTFVGIVWASDDRADIVRSADGVTWELVAAPRPGFVAGTGTIVDGELHLVGHTGSFENPTWWHYATGDATTWREVGTMTGMPASTYVLELRGSDLGWLARVSIPDPDSGDAGHSLSALRFSEDGQRWESPDLPVGDGIFYTGLAVSGDSLLALRYESDVELTTTVVLSSRDGATWLEHVVTTDVVGPRWLAFDGDDYVAVGASVESDEFVAAAWYSRDGTTWLRGRLDPSQGRAPNGLDLVLSTDIGFVAFGNTQGDAWVSVDGVQWRSYAIQPTTEDWMPFSAANLGDVVLLGGSGQPVVWIGRLSDLTGE